MKRRKLINCRNKIATLLFATVNAVYASSAVNSNDNSGQWAWMSGSASYNVLGTYYMEYAPSPYNMPGARINAAGMLDKTNNRLWMYGGIGYGSSSSEGYLSDLWEYDLNLNAWIWIGGSGSVNKAPVNGTKGAATASNTPGGRGQMTSWVDSAGKLWLFGGYAKSSSTSYGCRNDLFKYDPNNGYWVWVSGSNLYNQPGTYGNQGVAGSNYIPGTRALMVSWIDKNGKFWLFGGANFDPNASSKNTAMNDLWKYDPATNQWTWVSGSKYTNQSTISGNKGESSTTYNPGARYASVGWADNSNNLWLFGGRDINWNNYGDLWRYNIDTNKWTWVSGSTIANSQYGVYGELGVPAASNVPGMRYGGISWFDKTHNALWLFGGYGCVPYECGYLNDLWKYDIATGLWTWMGGSSLINQLGDYGVKGIFSTTNIPVSQYYSTSWVDNDGSFWLFGGYGYSPDIAHGELNALWKYVPPTN